MKTYFVCMLIVLLILAIYTVGFMDGKRFDYKQGQIDPLPTEVQEHTIRDLFYAMIWVESGGDPNAVGKKGEIGVFQISKIYVDDVNMLNQFRNPRYKYFAPPVWEYCHRKDPILSWEIVTDYMACYATKERLGREPTLEDMARIHNGGPTGWKKECTKVYWEKVKARMELS